MKYIVLGDIHLGVKQSKQDYLELSELLFKDICEYATTNQITKFAMVGDMFDNRKHISLNVLSTALSVGKMLESTFKESYMMIGNHDMFYRDRTYPTSLSVFEEFNDIIIVDEPTRCNGILMLPWLFDKDILDTSADDILMGHFEMNGITLNASGTVAEGFNLNQSDFKNFELVLSGHFHTPGKYGNIQYLGSPFQTTFNDMGNITGFYVLDTDTKEIEFIDWDKYPHHIRVMDYEKLPVNIKDNIVELHFTEDHGIEANRSIVESYKEQKPYKLIIKYLNVKDTFTDDEIEEDVGVKDTLELLLEYFDKAELTEGLNPVMIKAVIKKLYKEVVDGEG